MDIAEKNKGAVTVAFAEDHISVRKGIISYLHDLGGVKVTIEAGNGRELLEKLEHSKKRPDVCMIDIVMPEMNGFETVVAIRQKWPDMKILILSTYSDDLYVVKMIRYGVNGYLNKSCSPDEIKNALIAIYQRGNYHSEFFIEKTAMAIQDHSMLIPRLSEKELQFLELCCTEMTYAKIAEVMKTTPKSVDGYRDSLFRKLNINNRISLVLFAIKTGIVTLERPVA